MKLRAVTAIPLSMPVPIICSLRSYKGCIVTKKTPRIQSPFLCNIVTLVTVFISASAIHLSHHDIYAAENYHHVGPCVPQAQIFQHSQSDEVRLSHAVTILGGPCV